MQTTPVTQRELNEQVRIILVEHGYYPGSRIYSDKRVNGGRRIKFIDFSRQPANGHTEQAVITKVSRLFKKLGLADSHSARWFLSRGTVRSRPLRCFVIDIDGLVLFPPKQF
jgi:hypothetical protein